jgi:hypothetical protein
MLSEQGASTAATAPSSFAELMARDAAGKMATNTVSQTLNPEGKGREDGEASQEDWALENE